MSRWYRYQRENKSSKNTFFFNFCKFSGKKNMRGTGTRESPKSIESDGTGTRETPKSIESDGTGTSETRKAIQIDIDGTGTSETRTVIQSDAYHTHRDILQIVPLHHRAIIGIFKKKTL